jgi:basic membrane lipoprotein Med (substrate-binding protein (PBP1-ABC) superfamily)
MIGIIYQRLDELDPYFIRTRIVYDLQKPIVKAVMEWKNSFTFAKMSLTLKDLKFRLSNADSIAENKEEYLKAIDEVEKRIYEKTQEN